MSQSIRIRTTPDGQDTYVKVNINQTFDFIEVLSLKLSQDQAYQRFASDYGVVVGRVSINNGFGLPNAKVSIFIPLDDVDKQNLQIKTLYPYEVVTDKDIDGIRYNLLPKESDGGECNTPIGTFSSKREVLDNEQLLYVYQKYYKFTTTTNHAGDYMLFGVPLGNHVLHVDADISNIGIASQRPFDLIDQGVSPKMFYSPTKFKSSKNLDTLIQVKTTNTGINIKPFWGDTTVAEIGITRADIDLNYNIRPAAIFTGSIFGDSEKNSVNKNCRPRKNMGELCETTTGPGSIEMIRKTTEGDIEEFNIEGGRVIDDDGTWAYQIPMNLDYMVTDEFGNLVLSENQNIGIPTRARVRFRIGMDESGGLGRLRTRAKFLVPHNPTTFADRDFTFDKTTKDQHFTDLYWNKIYSIKSFIPRIQNEGGVDKRAMLGLKDLDKCTGDKTAFPYNRIDTNRNPLFSIICLFITILAEMVYLLNVILCAIRDTEFLNIRPFKNVIKPIKLKCPSDPQMDFTPGCQRDGTEPFIDCVSTVLAQDLNMFTLDFYNDWINGTLYAFSLKYKKKKKGKEKFCEYDCDDFSNTIHNNKCNSKLMLDSCVGGDGAKGAGTLSLADGFISDYKGTLYYSPIIHSGTFKMFATDIISLGSVYDCDWQGIPTLHEYLIPTTFKLPPLISETEEDETVCGMVNITTTTSTPGIFFSINCSGIKVNEENCNNIKKICELGVDIPSSAVGSVDCNVGLNEIYEPSDPIDSLNSTNRYIRNVFYGLNNSGVQPIYQLPGNIDIPQQGTSINIQNTGVSQVNGSNYNSFRGYYPQGAPYSQPLNNSYFFYFGLLPGKTALDKLNAKYFTPCTPVIVDDFIADTTVFDVSTTGGNDGKIDFIFIGGTAPYSYQWESFNYVFGPTQTNSGGTITNLVAGDYTLTVVDALGTSLIKEVTVSGPQSLNCHIGVIKQSTNFSSNDGKIQVQGLFGGLAPYQLRHIKPDTTTNTVNIHLYDILDGIPVGLNTFIISDSSSPTQTCQTELQITAPNVLNLTLDGTTTNCGQDGYGILTVEVTGGQLPYNIVTTGPNGYSSTNLTQDGLFAGTYTVTVSDSASQTITQSYTMSVGTPVIASVSTINNGGTYTHTVTATGGIPPYNGTGVFIDNNSTITVTVTDSLGCSSNPVTG